MKRYKIISIILTALLIMTTLNTPAFAGIIPGAMTVSSSKPTYITNEDIILSWTVSKNAARYGLTIRKAPYTGDANIVYDNGNLIGNSINIGKLPEGNYRFAMRGYSSSGIGGPVSNIVYFTVNQVKLVPPELKFNKQKYLCGEPINISWNKVTNADSYSIYFQGGNTNVNGLAAGIFGTNYSITTKIPGEYKIWGVSKSKTLYSPESDKKTIIVSDILLNSQTLIMSVGDTKRLTPRYSAGYTGKRKLTWSSYNKAIAVVDSNGLVTTKKAGKTIISISIDGKTIDTCNVISQSIITPIDINLGSWYAVTYGGNAVTRGEHWGTDYRAIDLNLPNNKDKGIPVKAVADGEVVKVFASYGEVHIKHTITLILKDESRTYNTWYSVYAHMSNITVKQGDKVAQGYVIGKISNKSADNDHLHFAITTKLTDTNNVSRDKKYNYYTLSPLWLGGNYKKIKYIPFSKDSYDSKAVLRLNEPTSSAPASN